MTRRWTLRTAAASSAEKGSLVRGRKNSAETDEQKQARRAVREAEEAYSTRSRDAERALDDAERAHAKHVRAAEKNLERAEQQYQAEVDRAQRAAEFARSGALEAAYGDVRLYPDRLESPEGTVPLSSDLRATVEATGTKTEKSDSRETILLLDTPSYDAVIRVNPNDTTGVRELAAKINTAAKNAEIRRQSHTAGITAAEADVQRVRADRAAIESAKTDLAAARADTQATELAARALERERAKTQELDSARAHLLQLDPSATVRATEELQRKPRSLKMRQAWRRRSRWTRIAIIAVTALVALVAIGALAGDPGKSKTAAVNDTAGATSTEAVKLDVVRPSSETSTVTSATHVLRGSITPGASLTVNGKTVATTAGAFETIVPLEIGENELVIRATKPGLEEASSTLSITRDLPVVTLRLEEPASEASTVRTSSIRIAGIASRGSVIKLNGQPLRLHGIRFAATVGLQQGENAFRLEAIKKGHQPDDIEFTIVRRLSAAEIAAKQAKAREQFIAQTRTIPYSQLIKNPEAYAGTKVRYYGEILQIQESGGGGIILLYVTDLGYDIWSDQIWVNYTGHVRGAQGDQLTVYGVVVGTRSYETQAGGETYVPEIDARYFVE